MGKNINSFIRTVSIIWHLLFSQLGGNFEARRTPPNSSYRPPATVIFINKKA